jgi:hypothetical protein
MTDLAVRDAYQPDRIIQRSGGIYERDIIDGWVQVMSDVAKLADYISETDFVPKSLRNKPAAIAACILTGRELGIGPMQSLKSIYMVQGVPSLSAEYKRARALAAGHEISIDETNSTRCIIRGRRAGTDRWVTITWNMDMAKRAKLAGKDIWQAYPQRMLQARASGELCDLLFPDASLGLATTEVLEDGGIVAESGELVDAATGELTTGTAGAIEAARPRTAQRKARADRPTTAVPAGDSVPEPPKSRTQGPANAATAPSDDLPPLPGEDEPDPTTSGASSSAHAPASASPPRTAGPSPSTSDGSATAPDDTDYDTAGTVTGPQLTRIWATLTGDVGFAHSEKDAARATCAAITGRDLASSKDLSRNDAGAVIDTLAAILDIARLRGGEPRAILAGLTRDPRAAALTELSRLGITSLDGQVNTAGQVLSITPPVSLESLTAGQAVQLAGTLARCTSKTQLDALLATGEVPDA